MHGNNLIMRRVRRAVLLLIAFSVATLADGETSVRLLRAEDPPVGGFARRRLEDTEGPTYSNDGEISNFPVAIGKPDELGFTGAYFTASAWVYRTAGGSQRDYTIFGTDQKSKNRGLHLVVRRGQFYMGFYHNDCGGAGESKLNKWQHVAFVFENGAMEIYVDGVREKRCTGKSRFQGDETVNIGRWAGKYRFEGKIKAAKIWPRVLSLPDLGRLAEESNMCDFGQLKDDIFREILSKLRLSLVAECQRMGEQVPKYLKGGAMPDEDQLRADLCPCMNGLGPNFIKKYFNCDINIHGHLLSTLDLWEDTCKEHPTCKWSTIERGAGYPLTECPGHKEKIGLLCYDKCPSGYYRSGFECIQNCPPGFRDDGLFCRKPEYGRGVGYAWWMKRDCDRDHSQGCERSGLIYYPKCKPGYKSFGCCICRPEKFDCVAMGFEAQFDLSCTKKTKAGNPTPMECAKGLEWGGAASAGLCYDPCPKGYNGVGPLCHRRRDCESLNPPPRTPRPTQEPTQEPTPRPTPVSVDPAPAPVTPKPAAAPTPAPEPESTPGPMPEQCNMSSWEEDITSHLIRKLALRATKPCTDASDYFQRWPSMTNQEMVELAASPKKVADHVCPCLRFMDKSFVKETFSCNIGPLNIFDDVYEIC